MTEKTTGKPLNRRMLEEAGWLFSYSLQYLRVILLYILIGVTGTVLGLLASLASKSLIDHVTGVAVGSVFGAAAAMILLNVVSIGLRALSGRIGARVNIRVTNEIQAHVFRRLLQADWESISAYRSGDLINRLNSDSSAAAGTIINFFPNAITAMCQFFGSLGIILYFDPIMALIALCSAPVSVLLSKVLVRRMRSYNEKMRAVSSEVMSFHSDTLQHLQTVKSLGLGNVFCSRFSDVQEKYRGVALEYNKFSILTSSIMSVMGLLVSVSTFGWGAYRLWSGYIAFGTLTLFLQLAGTLSSAFSSLVSLVPGFISAATSASRLMEITGLAQENSVEKLPPLAGDISVEFRDVSFAYKNGAPVMEHVSLCARPQEIIALVGPSGEGKTTLIRLLLGLLTPTAGQAVLLGSAEERALSAATRSYFTYVPQGNSCLSGTIAENLRIIRPGATEEELWAALETAGAADFVRQLPQGLQTVLGEKGAGLSEGQAQRIAIARAFLRDAPVLVLDEATSALDSRVEHFILQNLMQNRAHRTCILATHRSELLPLCTRIYHVEGTAVREISLDEARTAQL